MALPVIAPAVSAFACIRSLPCAIGATPLMQAMRQIAQTWLLLLVAALILWIGAGYLTRK